MTSAPLMGTYPEPRLTVDHGQGVWVYDNHGKAYLDAFAGIAVNALGHGHPALIEAVTTQVRQCAHVSNLVGSHLAPRLAQQLRACSGWADGRTFLCNSGTEANEAALKLAHRYGTDQDPNKRHVVSFVGGFHGRTRGSLRVTSHSPKTEAFEPLGDWNTQVTTLEELQAAVTAQTCAVILEVIQGESGINPLDPALIQAARDLCDLHDALLIIDEVQTGIGRCGQWFAFQTVGVEPDVITLAKGLGGGLPIGAVHARGKAANAFHQGDHGSTFGGNPVACAAALAVLDTIETEGLLAHVLEVGAILSAGLADLVATHPLALDQRGYGLIQALELTQPVGSQIVEAALDHGLLLNSPRPTTLRFVPPLIISQEEVGTLLTRLEAVLWQIQG